MRQRNQWTDFWRFVRKTPGCWLWTGKLVKGYGRFRFGSRQRRVHRVAFWMMRRRGWDQKLMVLHTCDTRNCVRPDHLYLGTAKDNAVDAVKRGRMWLEQDKKNGNKFVPRRKLNEIPKPH